MAQPEGVAPPNSSSRAAAAAAGISVCQAARRAKRAAMGNPVRAKKGPAGVETVADRARAQGIAVSTVCWRQSEERRRGHAPRVHGPSPGSGNPNQATGFHPHSRPVYGRRCGSGDRWQWYPSAKNAAETIVTSPRLVNTNVGKVARGERSHTGGYEFKWAPPPAVRPSQAHPTSASYTPDDEEEAAELSGRSDMDFSVSGPPLAGSEGPGPPKNKIK